MTPETLAKLLRARMDELGLTPYAFHLSIAGKVSHQTVYNALNGKPIKSDTLLIMLEKLDLEIVPRKKSRR